MNFEIIKKYFINFSWNMIGQFTKIFFGAFVTVYLINYLGPKDFGLLSFALSIVGILYPIATLGLDAIVFRNLISDQSKEKIIIKTAYLVRLISGSILLCVVVLFSFFFTNNKVLFFLLTILSIGMVLEAFSIYKEYFSSIVKHKYIALSSIIANIFSNIIKLLFIFTKFSVVWFSITFLIEKFLNVLFLKYFYNKKNQNKSIGFYNPKLAKEMIQDSWPLMFTSFAGILYMYSDQIIIKFYLGDEKVGLYAAAAKLVMFFYAIPAVLSNIMYPDVIKLNKNLKTWAFIKKLENIYFFNFIIALIFLILILIFGNLIIDVLLEDAFAQSVDVLYIYAFGLIFIFFAANNNKLLMIENLQKIMLIRNLIGLIFNIFLNFILIPQYGIKGAAFSTLISQFLIMLSYGLNPKTKYIFFLQIKVFIFPILIIKNKIFKS